MVCSLETTETQTQTMGRESGKNPGINETGRLYGMHLNHWHTLAFYIFFFAIAPLFNLLGLTSHFE